MKTIYVIVTGTSRKQEVWEVYDSDQLDWARRDLKDLAQEGVRAALLEYELV